LSAPPISDHDRQLLWIRELIIQVMCDCEFARFGERKKVLQQSVVKLRHAKEILNGHLKSVPIK
jgi:hypothetical protein